MINDDDFECRYETEVSIHTGNSKRGVPYTLLQIAYIGGYPITVYMYKYPTNVWIMYEDDRYGYDVVDMQDIVLSPKLLWKKIPILEFKFNKVMQDLERHLGIHISNADVFEILEELKKIKEKNNNDSL